VAGLKKVEDRVGGFVSHEKLTGYLTHSTRRAWSVGPPHLPVVNLGSELRLPLDPNFGSSVFR
jgi:hypothetical protein